jgi:hypothetical protein
MLIQYPESLCARLLKAKYYPNGEIVDTVFPGDGSPTWKVLEFGLELVKKRMQYGGSGQEPKSKYGVTHGLTEHHLGRLL